MPRKRYQEGGDVDVEGGLGAAGALDPSQALLEVITRQYTTTPEAQQYSRDLLDQILTQGKDRPESAAIQAKKAQTEQVREALRTARQRLQGQEYNRGDLLLAASQGFGLPTKTGSVGEIASNVFGALREPLAKRREFGRKRDESLSELDLAEAQAGSGVTDMEFELEKLDDQLKNRLAVEALQNLEKSTRPTGSERLTSVIPDSAKALDRTYAPEYLDFIKGGSAKAAQGLETLDFASKQLKSGKDSLTGPYIGTITSIPFIGRGIQDFFAPQGSDVRDMVEQTVQESLRPILGSQFTQQEGERLIARVFNPRLEEWRNARRLDYMVDQLKRAYENKVALAKYYQQNQTLFGFKGPLSYSIEDFIPPESVGRDEREEDIEGEGMSPAARASLRPGAMLGKDEQEVEDIRNAQQPRRSLPRAKGGRVRYQEGGLVLPPPEQGRDENESTGAEGIEELWDSLGYIPDMAGGASAGLLTEALLARIQRRKTGGAQRYVEDAIRREGKDPIEEAKEIKRGRRAGVPSQIMDIDAPGVQSLALSAFQNGGPDAARALDDLEERVSGSRERVNENVNKGVKPYNYTDLSNRLVNSASIDAQKKIFQPVYDKFPGLPQDDTLNQVIATPEGQKALQWAIRFYQNQPGKTIGKEDVTGMVQKPSLEFYDYIRKGFDQLIGREEARGPTEFSKVLRDMRHTLVGRLDQLAPKEYKEARQQYAGDLEVRDALTAGYEFQSLKPDELTALSKSMSFHEKNAFRTGIAQKLFETLDKPSSDINAAKKIVGSPQTMAQIEPFFDSPAEFKTFQTALEKEAELFKTGNKLVKRGEAARYQGERNRVSPLEYAAKRASGFRFSISPLGWALRVYRDLPKMTPKKATQMLEVLQRGEPAEMDAFIKTSERLAKLKSMRGPRRAIAAGVGAGAAALLGGLDEEPQE